MAANPTSFAILAQETSVLDSTDEFTALELTVREHARLVFKVAYGVLRNSHDAEDVVQEVYLRIHRSGIKGVEEMRAWLARVAFRLAIDRVRKPYPLELPAMEMPGSEPDAERLAIHR